jgi:selenocysteine lyase/cysteine desulfurase
MLWKKYRDQFPVTKNLVYLNHASIAPLCPPAAEAMRQLATDAQEYGSLHYPDWLNVYEGIRIATARMINATRDEIAIVKNTSEGIATIANGIAWRPGDKVVAFTEEFASNFFAWKHLEQRGVKVTWLSIFDHLNKIDEACRGARLLAISFVQYLSGFRADVVAIGEICARHNCLFFVDAIQGLGVFPLDVRAAKIDFLAADGHKWLMGPEGCGVLFVRRDRLEEVAPSEVGWVNMAKSGDYASRDMTWRHDAGRYECGTLNTIGCFGLHAALNFVLDLGTEKLAPEVRALADRVWEGAKAKGYEMLGRRSPECAAGIVSFRKAGQEALGKRLKDAGFITAPRAGWIRVSPHFYNSPDDIEALLALL